MRLCVVAGYVGVFVWILRGVHVIVCSCGICRCICVDIERFT